MSPESIPAVLLCALLLGGCTSGCTGPAPSPEPPGNITSFQECVQAGYPVMESYPRQCRTPDGRTFVEEVPPLVGCG
ncbi:MAG: hypothetical protein GXO65_01500 [Euryarchaeota archaeon]|nr:hypothetical protein [Euryarchaeota archaeon]